MSEKRGRRARRPPSPKREQVVDAAGRLFLSEGYGSAGMDAIAREAGVSKATVYSYYTDKASLFADVMHRMCDELGGGDLSALAGEPPEAALKGIAHFGLRRVLETAERGIVQRVVSEAREFPELGERFWSAGPGRIQEFLGAYLRDADRRGDLEVSDPEGAARHLVGLITGMYLLPLLVGHRARPTEAEMRRDVDRVVHAFLASHAPRTPRSPGDNARPRRR